MILSDKDQSKIDIIVSKFGGSSSATSQKIKQIKEILRLDERRRIIVLSAPGRTANISTKTTDILVEISTKICEGNDPSDGIKKVKKRYLEIYEPLGLSEKSIMDVCSVIDKRICADKKNRAMFRDGVVSLGEELNAYLFAEYLNTAGIISRYISPEKVGLIVTSDYGDAQPLHEAYENMKELIKLCRDSIIVFPGFFGTTSTGQIATFSRGGSDLTGAILSASVGAVEYENFTDVDGIFPVAPHIAEAERIPCLTYRELRELAYMGFHAFQSESMIPVMRSKIPIRVRNTNNIGNEGTLVTSERTPTQDVVGIASRGDFLCISIQKFQMNRVKGFGRELLSILYEHGISYEHCPSCIDSISLIIGQNQLSSKTILTSIINDIKEKLDPDEIRTEFNISLVAMVGEGLFHKVGALARATRALAESGINIKMVNQGSSEISVIFGIDSRFEEVAVKSLYKEFFYNDE